jgi:hypothetical protein
MPKNYIEWRWCDKSNVLLPIATHKELNKIYIFDAYLYAVLRNNSTGRWTRSQDNVFQLSDMSTCGQFSVNYQNSTKHIGHVQ